MSKELEKVREIFLTDVDEETLADNEAKIQEWEQGLIKSQAMASWQAHDMTKEMALQAKETYRDACMMLATNRDLTDRQRDALFAKQDASLWLLSMMDSNAVDNIRRIQKEIREAIKMG